MRQFLKENAKFSWLPLILISFIAFKMINDYKGVFVFLGLVLSVLTPVIIGIVVAYLLNPLAEMLRKKWKMKWGLSVLLVYLLFFCLIIVGAYFAIPAVVSSLQDLTSNIPLYINKTQAAVTDLLNRFGIVDSTAYTAGMKKIDSFFGDLLSVVKFTFSGVSNTVVAMASGITNFFIGIIISVYLLKGKKNFILLLKKTIYAMLGKDNGDFALACCKDANVVFSNYTSALILDSILVAIIDTIGLSILGAPYAVLLGILLGVFNLIPYFGPLIGVIISVLVALIFGGFVKALIVLVFIFVVFQFDAVVMGPKIFGSKIGVSPFWIIFSITVGGGFFGIPGMLLGTPVVVCIGLFISRYIEKRLMEQGVQIEEE